MFTQEYLKSILNYNELTGLFTWKIQLSNRNKIGNIAGAKNKIGYVVIGINGKTYYAHRLAWLYIYGKIEKNIIDHINGIKDDNRIENLRNVCKKINGQNRKNISYNNESGYLGVHWDNYSKKWKSSITINGKNKYLGRFNNIKLAHETYLKAKRELHEGCTI